MNYIRITKENIDKEHICCAMSGRQSVAKKEWLRQRFDDGLVFYRSEERGNALSNTFRLKTHGCLLRQTAISTLTVSGYPVP
jgi:hypothetical protein